MPRSIMAFAVSVAVVLTTETSYAAQRGTAKSQPGARSGSAKAGTPKTAARGTAKKAAAKAVVLTSVQQKLQRNARLAGTVSGRLPAGTDLMAASAGFRNLGQFVAAVNASSNLGIPFAELKRRMVGDGMTLGLALQDLRPRSRYWPEARRAEEDAEAIIRATTEPEAPAAGQHPAMYSTAKASPRPGV